jgi:hypothetical protein
VDFLIDRIIFYVIIKIKMIKAVITYYYKGTEGVIGATIGADGRGHYSTIITGDDYVKVNEAMYNEAIQLTNYPRITDVVMVIQDYPVNSKIKEIRV